MDPIVVSKDKPEQLMTPARLAQAVTGDAWTLHILRHAFRGTRRYSQWRELFAGEGMPIPEPVLSDRLGRLVSYQVLERQPTTPQGAHLEYRLTDRGLELWTLLISIRDWEERYAGGRRGKNTAMIVHTSCGHPTHPTLICSHCSKTVTARDTRLDMIVAKSGTSAAKLLKVPNTRRSNAAERGARGKFLRTQTLQIIGDRWSNMLLGALFLGKHGFDELRGFLAIPPAVLSNRLAKFVSLGVLQKENHAETPRRKFYRLTDKGLALFPLVIFTVDWGNRWLTAHPEHFRIVHTTCGATLRPTLACSHCHEHLQRQTVQLVP
ncbi:MULTISPECIES: helix-turn-helix domain-containing protein [unclassified Beijerinckia]|uniref:winged helix-turn-helix transcriptional regulator n=1 Tax=unclassified Beijerinckia TaxID=2638183 RepID=UPI0008986523|nr:MULTISPECIES: helix-turn-helix domain-containing protein [unclassified Beijerinckia]MDH7796316.1 DNA-binding HxlR family transcriptional regulator [Beijerinckia sp. GAS462]SEC39655.1 transcriptional regulator, HxlR family [Beijerinckia sp. 28-YEA-48]